MKINSISLNYNNKNINFKHSAVPYPEYEYAYYSPKNLSFENKVSQAFKKISSLFTPDVSRESYKIKSNIDNIYAINEKKLDPKAKLLSVLA